MKETRLETIYQPALGNLNWDRWKRSECEKDWIGRRGRGTVVDIVERDIGWNRGQWEDTHLNLADSNGMPWYGRLSAGLMSTHTNSVKTLSILILNWFSLKYLNTLPKSQCNGHEQTLYC